jgi:hypothetical protein
MFIANLNSFFGRVKKVSFADQFVVYCCRWTRKGLKTSSPFLGKLQQYVDAWATTSQNVVVESRLHDDDAWRAYLQLYTTRTRTRVTYIPTNPRLDLVLALTYPYRRD